MTPVHSFWLIDLLDILLVAALFYRFLIAVKGTRSAQMYVGLLMIVLVAFLSRQFDLIAVRWIAESLKTVWLIAFISSASVTTSPSKPRSSRSRSCRTGRLIVAGSSPSDRTTMCAVMMERTPAAIAARNGTSASGSSSRSRS